MKKIYALHSGYIFKKISHPDDPRPPRLQRHYIRFIDLLRLYKLSRTICVEWNDNDPRTFEGRRWSDYIHLYPVEGSYEQALIDATNETNET